MHDDPKTVGLIYVLKGEDGYCKIGRTLDVHKRLNSFAPKLPIKTELAYVFVARDMYRAERELHDMFASKRTNGEWFKLTEQDLAFFEQHPLPLFVHTYHLCNARDPWLDVTEECLENCIRSRDRSILCPS